MTAPLPQSAEQMTDILDIEALILSPWSRYLTVGAWLLVFLLGLVLALFLYFRWRSRRAKIIKLSPYDQAEKDLRSLTESRILSSDKGAAFYFRLTEILKRYLEDEFHVRVTDKTTDEILALKEGLSVFLEASEKERFQTFLLKCDAVKFAKWPVPHEEAVRDLGWVRAFVNQAHAKALKREDKSKTPS